MRKGFLWLKDWTRALLWRARRALAGRVDYIGGGQTLPPPFTREEEERIMQALRDGDC